MAKKNKTLLFLFILILISYKSIAQLTSQQELNLLLNTIDSLNNGSTMYETVIKRLNSKAFKKDLLALMDKSKEKAGFEYNLDECHFIVIPTLKIESQYFLDSLYFPIEVKIFQDEKYIGEYVSYTNIKIINMAEMKNHSSKTVTEIGTFQDINNIVGLERYTGVSRDTIAITIKELNPDLIFSIKGWYHSYFYYKSRKIYCFDIKELTSKELLIPSLKSQK